MPSHPPAYIPYRRFDLVGKQGGKKQVCKTPKRMHGTLVLSKHYCSWRLPTSSTRISGVRFCPQKWGKKQRSPKYTWRQKYRPYSAGFHWCMADRALQNPLGNGAALLCGWIVRALAWMSRLPPTLFSKMPNYTISFLYYDLYLFFPLKPNFTANHYADQSPLWANCSNVPFNNGCFKCDQSLTLIQPYNSYTNISQQVRKIKSKWMNKCFNFKPFHSSLSWLKVSQIPSFPDSSLNKTTQSTLWSSLVEMSNALPPNRILSSYDLKHNSKSSMNPFPTNKSINLNITNMPPPFSRIIVNTQLPSSTCGRFPSFSYWPRAWPLQWSHWSMAGKAHTDSSHNEGESQEKEARKLLFGTICIKVPYRSRDNERW